jgi:hypothetical protein
METTISPNNQNLNQNPISNIPQKNIYKTLFFIFLSLFLLLLITIIVVAILSFPQKSTASLVGKIQEETITTTAPSEPTTIPTEAEPTSSILKDWKNYTNTDYNYSIKYPSTWTVDLQSKDRRGKAVPTFLAPGMNNVPHDKIVEIQVSPTTDVSRVDSADYIKLNGNVIISTSPVVVGGIPTDKFITKLNKGYDIIVYVDKNLETYSLNLNNTTSSDKEYIDNFNLMISTFKFN